MSPIVLLAGAGLALLVLASSKGGKADSSTCLPGAVKQMFASLSKTEFQTLAAMARQQGNEEVASCYDKLAAGEPCPLAASGTEASPRISRPRFSRAWP